MAGLVVRIIDRRVGRSFDPPLANDLVCGPSTDLNDIFAQVADRAYTTKIETLLIMSHAFYEKDDGGAEHYGFGIQLGQQNLKPDTIEALMGRLRGRFASRGRGIELRGCGAAAKSEFTVHIGGRPLVKAGDGVKLCQLIADTTDTGVLASTDEQPGSCRVVPAGQVTRIGGAITSTTAAEVALCEVGVWEGKVWLFTPKSNKPPAAFPHH